MYFFIMIFEFLIIIYLICRIIRNNKKSSKDMTVFNLAHEIKNPIAVCCGYLDMLDVNDSNKVKRYVPIIKKEMNRALEIMNEFLNFKRLKVNKDLMDFSLLMDDINTTMDIILKNNCVSLNIPKIEKELIIDGDYDKLKQVLINLIKNSYEANAKNITIEVKKSKKCLKVMIIDDGNGISEYDLKRIGNLFYTTKINGNGIGVSLSKEIIKLHNGNLSYSSFPNKGTTATLILPLKYVF